MSFLAYASRAKKLNSVDGGEDQREHERAIAFVSEIKIGLCRTVEWRRYSTLKIW